MAKEPIIPLTSVSLGCDPEIFLTKAGQVIGAEKVIPDSGLGLTNDGHCRLRPTVVLDGVQVELNPAPNICRESLAYNIAGAFTALRNRLAEMKDIKADFHQIVEVDPKELESLSEKAKALGCAPSLNIYDSKAKIGIDPATYTKRSAGGHIHLGLQPGSPVYKNRERLVPLLDIFLGNTSVMIDRHPGNAERRQVYGRAGEHRLPIHGLEYRTLSNFWLRSYPLMSGVMALARQTVQVLANTLNRDFSAVGMRDGFRGAEEEILQKVDLEAVQRAINTNDLGLAKKNWAVVRDYIADHFPTQFYYGLNAGNLEYFDYFIKKIDEDGLDYWWKSDPLKHWTKHNRGPGWESFLLKVRDEQLGAIKHRAA